MEKLQPTRRVHTREKRRRGSEDVFEMFDAVGFEEDQQDECPQAEDEAVWRMPVLLFGFL